MDSPVKKKVPLVTTRRTYGRRKSMVFAGLLAMFAGPWLSTQALFSAQNPAMPPSTVAEWDPTKTPSPGGQFVGRAVCAECHVAEARSQPATPMGKAAQSVAECEILRNHPVLKFRFGPYDYKIIRDGNQSIYSVTEGTEKMSVPLLWAFGMGEAGQTYVFEKAGAYYESRVSFFNDVQKLDLTLGASREMPPTIEEALGKRQTREDATLCISCHTTGAVSGNILHVNTMMLGVSCEACHGPGGQHVRAIKSGHLETANIINPGKLVAGDLDEFCGSCHRTWWKVQLMHVKGVSNVRFQPYRLENSRCWSSDDTRISCVACHNPHEPLQRNATFYDSKCLSCHVRRGAKFSANHPGHACPVDTKNCIICHMPKYELPGGHFKFTDHQIRVVRSGETYPN